MVCYLVLWRYVPVFVDAVNVIDSDVGLREFALRSLLLELYLKRVSVGWFLEIHAIEEPSRNVFSLFLVGRIQDLAQFLHIGLSCKRPPGLPILPSKVLRPSCTSYGLS